MTTREPAANGSAAGAEPQAARADATNPVLPSESAWADESKELPASVPLSQLEPAPPSRNLSLNEEAVAAVPDPTQPQPIESKSRTINTSANRASNPSKINTYEIAGLEPVQNEHLQKEEAGHVSRNRSGQVALNVAP